MEKISSKIISVACGHSHTALLDENGDLLTCGNGIHGQLGHSIEKDQLTPKLVEVLSGKKLQVIACGEFHTLVASINDVYSFGRGSMGRLGHDDTNDQLVPKLIETLSGVHIIALAGGHTHSLALAEGKVYSWGCAEHGRVS